MAHSYLSVENSNTKRAVGVTDSMLNIFMYFFNEVAKEEESSNYSENEICNHYKMELLELHTSYVDLMLEEIYADDILKSWYFSMLNKVQLLVDSYGEYVDNNYLNSVTELNREYSRPISVAKLKHLINDIYWVLNKDGSRPSDEFKWFEDPC